MRNEKLVIVLRYIVISFMVINLCYFKSKAITINTVLLMLLSILNNQIRFYILYKNDIYTTISIVLEIFLSVMIYKYFGGIVFIYFIITIMDITLLLKKNLSYVLNSISLITVNYLAYKNGIRELSITFVSLVVLVTLLYYVKQAFNSKKNAELLYDKLRISEDNLTKANKELESYVSSIEELTVLRERNRISREIHDSVGHSLSTMIIQLGAIEKVAVNNGEMASDLAKNLGDFARKSLQEARNAVRELKPKELEENQGLLAIEELIKNFKKMTDIKVKLFYSKEKWQLNSDQCFVIYRVIQELLSNSLRHGKATEIDIFFKFSKNDLNISYSDNGEGNNEIKKGFGLNGIEERIKGLGGYVEFKSKLHQGFKAKISINKSEDLISKLGE